MHKNITGPKLQLTVSEKMEIERDCEEEREGFPVPTFPLLRFIIVRMLAG